MKNLKQILKGEEQLTPVQEVLVRGVARYKRSKARKLIRQQALAFGLSINELKLFN